MQTISSLFDNKKYEVKKTRKTERSELVDDFCGRLNELRGDYKALSLSHVAYLLSVYKTDELRYFLDKCKSSKHFAKCFWYHVKPKSAVKSSVDK